MTIISVKFITAFQMIALASAAPSATVNLRRGERRTETPHRSDEVGGDDENQSRTLLVRIKRETTLPDACALLATAAGGEVAAVYDAVLHGCAIEMPSQRMASASMAIIKAKSSVIAVEEDRPVYASYSWGLDRVDQCDLPLGGSLTKVDATGVRVYIVDTGIDANHADFDGTIDSGSGCHANMASDGTGAFDDGNGHGTHVAGTACGNTYGVAHGCNLCAVRVLGNDGSGSYQGVIRGLNHAVQDCAAAFPNGAARRCVANLSLGGGFSATFNKAMADAVDAGVVLVVAAGNDNGNACNYSPASEPKAITVGSTTRSDGASGFSNFGSCVDVYGPGSDIVSARAGSTSGAATFSGTSMASPHVAGIAAGILREDAAADVDARLKAHAKLLAAQAQDGSSMLLATAVSGGCGGGGGPPPSPVVTPTTAPNQAPVNNPSPAPVPSNDNVPSPSPTDYGYGDDDDNSGGNDDGTFPTPVPSGDSMPSSTDYGYGDDDDNTSDDGDGTFPTPAPSYDSMPSSTDYGYGDDDDNAGDDGDGTFPTPAPSDDSMPSSTDYGYGDDDDTTGDDNDGTFPTSAPSDESMPSSTDYGYGDDDDNTSDDGDDNFPTLTPSADSMPSSTDYGYGDDDDSTGDDGDGTFPTPVPSDESMPSPTDYEFGDDDKNNGNDGDGTFPTPVPSTDSMPSSTDYEFGDDDEKNGHAGDGTSPAPVPSDNSVPSPTASSKDTVAAPGGTAKAGKKTSKSKTSKVSKVSKTQVRMKVHANPFS